jgi:L-serine dehydratase
VLALANEAGQKSPGEVRAALTYLGAVMRASVERGLASDTLLPGAITRRAGAQADALHAAGGTPVQWCTVFATAVGEENACGGRVVAAPTSGAAGPVAALLVHWRESTPMATDEGVVDFLLTAGTIGGLLRASGLRQAGCQSAVGVAAAMAAAGYAAVQGASNRQVLRAAELALEPHLGLACDPVGGRVQQPCIERNAAGAARAYAAAEAAIHHPDPRSALDSLTRSMIESGRGMTQRYKEASISNAPVNIAEC